MDDKEKKKTGRTVKNWIMPIDASPEDIAKAIFKDADKNIKRENNQKEDK